LRTLSWENPRLLASDLSSGLASPRTGEDKHIHFNEQVEQCIALEMTNDEDEEIAIWDDSDSDDGVLMMKRKSKLPSTGKSQVSQRTSHGADGKMIVILPSTTLKDREDMPGRQRRWRSTVTAGATAANFT
jgi:hypothetical protein